MTIGFQGREDIPELERGNKSKETVNGFVYMKIRFLIFKKFSKVNLGAWGHLQHYKSRKPLIILFEIFSHH